MSWSLSVQKQPEYIERDLLDRLLLDLAAEHTRRINEIRSVWANDPILAESVLDTPDVCPPAANKSRSTNPGMIFQASDTPRPKYSDSSELPRPAAVPSAMREFGALATGVTISEDKDFVKPEALHTALSHLAEGESANDISNGAPGVATTSDTLQVIHSDWSEVPTPALVPHAKKEFSALANDPSLAEDVDPHDSEQGIPSIDISTTLETQCSLSGAESGDTCEPTPSQTRQSILSARNLQYLVEDHFEGSAHWLIELIEGPFDGICCCVILLSVFCLFIQYEYEGAIAGETLGKVQVWPNLHFTFTVLEHVFNGFFICELLLRLAVLKTAYFWNYRTSEARKDNLADVIIVIGTSLDLYIGQEFGKGTRLLRLFRCLRFARAFRLLRVMHLFGKLRVLICTVARSFSSLLWSCVLLGMFIMVFSMTTCRLVQPNIANSELEFDLREWMYQSYGTSSRATWTFFLMTFSGCWPNYIAPLVELNVWFAFFFGAYAFVVIFGVTRVVTALFLKDTMQVASQDAEAMVEERLKHRQEYVKKLTEVFLAADTSGDGSLSLGEFAQLLSIPKVKTWFQVLDLEVHEVVGVFNLLADGRGKVTYDEYLEGIMRLKGQARSLDVVAISRDCRVLMRSCSALQASFDRMENRLSGALGLHSKAR